MNCVDFEQRLARLMAEDPTEDERSRLLASLSTHAAECATCGGSRALLDVLALPPGERDIAPDPGDAYWSGFEARLEPRLAPEGSNRHVSRRVWWAAAAAVVLMLVAGWLFRGPGETGLASRGEVAPTSGSTELTPADLPPELVLSVNRASAEEVEDQLAALELWDTGTDPEWAAGDDAGDWEGELFPDVGDLDAETRERLLDWLRGENLRLEGVEG